MKVVLTGGGTGGHFYPLIGVAQELNQMAEQQKIVDMKLYFISDAPYDERALFENRITFSKIEAGKMRTYRSVRNILDLFKTGFGTLRAIWKIFRLYPDVIFSKGAYSSFPVLLAARFFRIPVLLHESDSVPGRVNSWSAKFARRIYVAFADTAKLFPEKKTAVVGVPMRRELLHPVHEGAYEFLRLDPKIPILFIVGGSQGAQLINDAILDILPELVKTVQIVHQTGRANLAEVTGRAKVVLNGSEFKDRYAAYDFLNEGALRNVAAVATLAISRGGATSIFELAQWNIPSIVIPITDSHGDHQRKNAFAYARAGAATVIEERNLTPHILSAEVTRLIGDTATREAMRTAAKSFALPDASKKIAEDIIAIGLSHESR